MTTDNIKSFLHKRPFEPFRVVLSSGESFEVSDPENAKLVRNGLFIFYRTKPEEEYPDRFRVCSLLHIAAIDGTIPNQ